MNHFNVRNELNEKLLRKFEGNRSRYERYFERAMNALEEDTPRLISLPVFEPFGNGARYPHYTFKLTSIFGTRGRGFHRGDDLRTVNVFHPGHELPVQAVENGRVIAKRYSNLWGNYIIVAHPNGLESLYAHNSRIFIAAGNAVRKGQLISLTGRTGNVSGPHMHFGVRAKIKDRYYWLEPSLVNWKKTVVGMINTRSGLSLRRRGHSGAERMLLIPGGAHVLVKSTRGPREKLDGVNAPWLPVWYEYKLGWVYSAYLDLHNLASPSAPRAASRKKSNSLRNLSKNDLLKLAMAMGVVVEPEDGKQTIAAVLEKRMAQAHAALAKSRKGHTVAQILKLSPEDIRGVSKGDAVKIKSAFRISSVGALADFKAAATARVFKAMKDFKLEP